MTPPEIIDHIENGKYVEFRARHDATLASLVNQIADDPEIAGLGLGRMIADRIVVERAEVETRRRELREKLVPAAQKEADDLLATAQAEVEGYRQVNPQFDQSEEGMRGTIGVPQRKHRVVPASLRVVGLAVHAAVAPIDVGEQVRREQTVVEPGVEHPALGPRATANHDPPQGLVPQLSGRTPDLFEIPSGILGLEITPRAGDIHRRDPDLHQ